MTEHPERGPEAPLAHQRQATIDVLCEHFANDALSVEEFERRVDAAHGASSETELRELLRDLPSSELPAVPDSTSPGARRSYSVTAAENVKPSAWSVAVMGGVSKKGRWTPARTNYVVAVMGGAEIDFREAALGPGVTEVQIWAVWGGVEVIVPPGINVETHGIGIMGAFEHVTHDEAPDPMAPTLRITGLAMMGGVEVTVRYAGESARDARRRRRQERREKSRQDRLDRRLHRGRSRLRD
ncbi:MAG TPA: DUF1707 domain-containing protein [Longimicrobiales bacterium]|nr:DUF1707 domain-containing protein [Longimicrobiales bacterium]